MKNFSKEIKMIAEELKKFYTEFFMQNFPETLKEISIEDIYKGISDIFWQRHIEVLGNVSAWEMEMISQEIIKNADEIKKFLLKELN